MATDKNMQIKSFNGTDWDNLFPKTKSDLVTMTDGTTLTSTVNTINTNVGNKVDKVTGMGLSSNDFTTALKTKLSDMQGVSVSATTPTDTNATPIWFDLV